MGRGPRSRHARNHKCTVTKGGHARKLKAHIKKSGKALAAVPAGGHEPETTVPGTRAHHLKREVDITLPSQSDALGGKQNFWLLEP